MAYGSFVENDGFLKTDLQEKMETLNKVIENISWKYEPNVAEINQAKKLMKTMAEFLSFFKEKK